jgi:tetratricopeptide (TPR) repeat protein/predicted Ser/Thr protein kinase
MGLDPPPLGLPLDAPGTKLSHYRILRQIGAGGMGHVYLAEDDILRRQVALKVLPEDLTSDPERRRRFVQEARAAAAIDHPHIAAVYGIEEVDGRIVIAMEYVRGQSLRTVITVRRLELAPAIELALQIAEALCKAHERGVVHRDLKPENIMVSEDGYAKIIDFGLAKLLERGLAPLNTTTAAGPPSEATRTRELTRDGQILGTLAYMSPEQARAQPVDARSDIFSFGVVLYEMLSGEDPFKRPTALDTLTAIVHDEAPPLHLPAMPRELQRIFRRTLAKEPSERYPDSRELVADLRAVRDQVLRARRPHLRRNTLVSVLAASVVVAITWWLARPRTAPAPAKPLSVLIADFANQTGDRVFQGSMEQALGIGMEGATFITSYPRDAALRVAQQIRPGRALDEETARLVAGREGINVVLAGAIASDAGGYTISANAVDPSDGKVLETVRVSAAGKGEVLRAVETVAATLRRRLGDADPESARRAAAETFTAASLEAAHEFSRAQDLASAGKDEEAIVGYKRALERDADFGRAYAAWGVSAAKLGRPEESARAYGEAFSRMDRMTEREKYRTLGTYYLTNTRNYDKAIENYTALVARYPADRAGHSNLALAYFHVLNFPKALEEARASVKIYPRIATFRSNLALYAMYSGDFATAATEAARVVEQEPTFAKAYLPLAMAALAKGDAEGAREAYRRMGEAGPRGQSLASAGLADLAMYEGRFADAVAILEEAIPRDAQTGNKAGQASKTIALAEAYEALGRAPEALQAGGEALKLVQDESTLFPVARLRASAGRLREARDVATTLGAQLQPRPRAYGKLIEAEVARREGRAAEAVTALREAQPFADVWMRRYLLGVAYVEAGHFAEALSELETCVKRQGEVTAVFFDDVPTYRYMVPAHYWLGRAQEGLGMSSQARESYDRLLRLRRDSSDALSSDARVRLAKLSR